MLRRFLGIWLLLGCFCLEIWGCHLFEKLLRRLFCNAGLDWKLVEMAATVEWRGCYHLLKENPIEHSFLG